MGSQDQNNPHAGPLAQALRPAVEGGRFDEALRKAREHQTRHPGDEEAPRVVQALELIVSQIWLSGTTGDDPGYEEAIRRLDAGDLAAARDSYDGIVARHPAARNAVRLARSARVIEALLTGRPLPREEPSSPSVASRPPAPPSGAESTRVAADGDLPLSAFDEDDATADVVPVIPPDAYRSEPTRHLEPGDYEIIEEDEAEQYEVGRFEADRARAGTARADSTGPASVTPPPLREKPAAPPTPPAPPAERGQPSAASSSAPSSGGASVETTRVAAPGELPLEELRQQLEQEADASLDDLLDATEEPGAAARRTSSQPPRPASIIPPIEALSRERTSQPPLPTADVAVPDPRARWDVREPGVDDLEGRAEATAGRSLASLEPSWSGVRAYEGAASSFDAGLDGVDADRWGDGWEDEAPRPGGGEPGGAVGGEADAEREAEACVERGQLTEALRIYQEVAAKAPDDERLWGRIAEVARLLQERSKSER